MTTSDGEGVGEVVGVLDTSTDPEDVMVPDAVMETSELVEVVVDTIADLDTEVEEDNEAVMEDVEDSEELVEGEVEEVMEEEGDFYSLDLMEVVGFA
jgi:hypothetical protein